MKIPLPLSDNDFTLFQKLLVEESGLYFDKDRSDSLRAAIWDRTQAREFGSYQEYYNLLKFHPEGRIEIRDLLDRITIGETYFFRNRPQFDALMKSVLPEVIQKKMYSDDKKIRIWSAGCSKGDEAHSIAIAIMETLPSYEQWDISILGTDVNRESLIAAKEGIYGKKDVGHLPKEYLEKYFTKRGTTHILDKGVRRLARFDYHNLAKDPFTMDGMVNIDLIFCRNVTIYFDLPTTKKVINGFYNSLRRDGYLFIGHAETLWQINNKFETVEFPQTFIYKKTLHEVEEEIKPFVGIPEIRLDDLAPIEDAIRAEEMFPAGSGTAVQDIPDKIMAEATEESVFEAPLSENERPLNTPISEGTDYQYKQAAEYFEKKEYEKALQIFDSIISGDEDQVRAHFGKATILANQEKYEEAVDTLYKIIKTDNLYTEAYYLLGVLFYKTGDYEGSEKEFRKVIYVDPDIVLAYFNLGNIYMYRKQPDKAEREYKNAVKILQKRDKEEHVRFCEDFTVEFLLRACRNSLEEIAKRS